MYCATVEIAQTGFGAAGMSPVKKLDNEQLPKIMISLRCLVVQL